MRAALRLVALVAPVLTALAGCQHEPVSAEEALVEDGRAIAQAQCASCHAIGLRDHGPRADAPPLREISQRYQFPVLEEELINGIHVGHQSMPTFQFSPSGTDALLAYLRHIQRAEREGQE